MAGDARAPAAAAAAAPAGPRNAENYKVQPKAVKEPYSEQALRDVQRQAAAAPPPTPSCAAPRRTGACRTGTPLRPRRRSGAAAAGAQHGSHAAGAPPPPRVRAQARRRTRCRAGVAAPPRRRRPTTTRSLAWPATGKLVTGFRTRANLKGIDIAGKAGQPVLASAAGKVVYAGTGLRGYGKLVIVKHNNTFLSAYAHNSELLVKEGQQVGGPEDRRDGQHRQRPGEAAFRDPALGKPVDPLKYLPLTGAAWARRGSTLPGV